MKMDEVRKRAKKLGLKTGGKKKVDIIRAIQEAEGNAPCFKTGMDDCAEMDCCWRDECIDQKK